MDQRKALLSVVGALVLGAGALFVQQEDEGVGCDLDASAVPLVVGAVTDGRSAHLGRGCTGVIETWREDPTAFAEVTIAADGETVREEVTFFDLAGAAPPPNEAAVDPVRGLGCFRWQTDLLRRMCLEGGIDPPAG